MGKGNILKTSFFIFQILVTMENFYCFILLVPEITVFGMKRVVKIVEKKVS